MQLNGTLEKCISHLTKCAWRYLSVILEAEGHVLFDFLPDKWKRKFYREQQMDHGEFWKSEMNNNRILVVLFAVGCFKPVA